jgi:hypothetical protein
LQRTKKHRERTTVAKHSALIAFSAILAATAATLAQAEPAASLLADLANPKTFTVGRESSYDPTGGNADGRHDNPMQPGETRTIADLEGPGAITHLWFTVASKDPQYLKNIVLRIFWDGEQSPSVESPIGDFFGLGNNRVYQYASLPIQIGTEGGLNCFWRMPFAASARITVTNDGPVPCTAFYYYVDYQKLAAPPQSLLRFHAQYRQAFPCQGPENYVFMDAEGQGHYVGVNLSIHNRASAWWGEGDDMIYIDGVQEPTLHGTGSEDYFCGAWAYGAPFANPYFGAPLIDGQHNQNAVWNVYRYHLEDPIPFTKSIRVTMEHGHANDRSDDWSSVAYWYQTEPHKSFDPLPEPKDRMWAQATVYTEPWAKEAETLAPLFQTDEVSSQSTEQWGNSWSFGRHLFFNAAGPAVYRTDLPVHPSDAGAFLFEIWYTAGPGYGLCELWLNGQKIGAWDGYSAGGVVRKQAEGKQPGVLKPAGNVLEIRITGKNASSTGFLAGFDCFKLTPQ